MPQGVWADGLAIPARRATRRTVRPAPFRYSRRPSAASKIGPSVRVRRPRASHQVTTRRLTNGVGDQRPLPIADSAFPVGGEFAATEQAQNRQFWASCPLCDRPFLAWARCCGAAVDAAARTRCAARSSSGNCAGVRDDRALPADESDIPAVMSTDNRLGVCRSARPDPGEEDIRRAVLGQRCWGREERGEAAAW